MKVLLRNLRGQKRELGYAILLGSAALTASVGLLACSAWLISMASTRPPVLVLEVAIVAVRFFGLSRGVFRYFGRILEHSSALKIQSNLRVNIYNKISQLPPSQLLEYKRGSLMQQIVSDVEGVQDLWLRLGIPWLSALISGVAGLGIIFALLPTLATLLSAIFLATVLLLPIIGALSQIKVSQRDGEAELFRQVMQGCESVNESIIFNYQESLFEQIEVQQDSISVIENRAAKWSGLGNALYSKALGFSLIIASLFSASAFSRGEIAGVNVAVLILLPLAIFDGLSSLPLAFTRTKRTLDSVKALEPILTINPTYEAPHQKIAEERCEIVISQARPIVENRSLPAFNGIASPGHPLVIMGKSGLGKSSLFNAILGFVDFTGEIAINGVPVRELDTQSISVLLQDDYLFNTSIRENLKIASQEITDQEIMEVLKEVELDSLLSSLPLGLDTILGSFGYNFSGGEKQRLKLARVLLRKSPIYLLDEPFEFLDPSQANRIAMNLLSLLGKSTLVIVSHLPLPLES